MKRWLFIAGIVTILLLLFIWAYLLFFGAPSKEELYGIFDFGDTTDESVVVLPPAPEEEVLPSELAQLRQLSTRTIAGYRESEALTSSSSLVYFVEAGTGHIFSLDIATGAETRLSNITIPGANAAVFSRNAQHVVIRSNSGGNGEVVIINFSKDGIPNSKSLTEVTGDFTISDDNDLLFASTVGGTTKGKVYNFDANSSRVLFDVPFAHARVDWGEATRDSHYVYPRASSRLEGFLYRITDGTMRRTPLSGYGLTAATNPNFSLYAKQSNGSYSSYLYNYETQTATALFATFLPEKCVFANTSVTTAICGNSVSGTYDTSIPDNWYQGVTSYTDELWQLDFATGETVLLTETFTLTGRALDIINLQMDASDARLYFINKNDQTLWLYELLK